MGEDALHGWHLFYQFEDLSSVLKTHWVWWAPAIPVLARQRQDILHFHGEPISLLVSFRPMRNSVTIPKVTPQVLFVLWHTYIHEYV